MNDRTGFDAATRIVAGDDGTNYDGVAIFLHWATAVLVARLVWRWIPGHQVAALEAGWMRLASKAVHYALYALLAAEAALGFAFRWGAGRPMEFFGLGLPPLIGEMAKPLRHDLRELHEKIGWAIVIIALLHALAALYHHYVLKDRVLERILPPARRG